MPPRRFDGLPLRTVCGHRVPVASGFASRLLGLAGLSHAAAGPGLLIPRCAAVHTFGMRFPLDLVFLDGAGRPLSVRRGLAPGRFARQRGAAAVLELPAAQGGEFSPPAT